MPARLTPKQVAFDAAVKARRNFDYRGIADLAELRERDPARGPQLDQLSQLRDSFNAALAVEGQNIVGDAPHAPFYLDYLDSDTCNAWAFRDDLHSFIGVTLPLVIEISSITQRVVDSDAVVSLMGMPLTVDRDTLKGVLFSMLLGFVASHEYAHHTHGHLVHPKDSRPIVGRLWLQAREADADGWAAYLVLNLWGLADARPVLLKLLSLENAPPSAQDAVAFACFVVAHAAFVLRHPEPIDKNKVYWETHPPQPVRLQLMSRFVVKFMNEFRPSVRETLTQPWYQSLMNTLTRLIWTSDNDAAIWHEQAHCLRAPDGAAYVEALIAELDVFRAVLRQWEAEARAALTRDP
ncbi:MAG: hypothetical protein A3H28_14685 [Acidobacteria bacterium RIFCSPLOWO2_02_FULL_61_28]|nr:MAG: hypothetical protein A3H28_14685 [Acidobacteria bacterium RIFCSPLOWO2_02_FULL_61_28]